MILQRDPQAALRPFVKTLWVAASTARPTLVTTSRERILPTGEMHVAIRLSDHPVCLFDGLDDARGHCLGPAVVGGARDGFYLRDKPGAAHTVGAQLRAGTSEVLFGCHADTFTGRHAPLVELWGRSAVRAREQLLDASDPASQLDVLESILAERLGRARRVHPAVLMALSMFSAEADVGEAVRQSGYSHRSFITLFRRAVGLTPKLYCRLIRFQKALDRIKSPPTETGTWAGLALAAGFSDQAHFNREFRDFTGLTPEEYRSLSHGQAFHVPVPD